MAEKSVTAAIKETRTRIQNDLKDILEKRGITRNLEKQINNVQTNVEKQVTSLQNNLENTMNKVLKNLNIATRNDIEQLSKKVDRLAAQMIKKPASKAKAKPKAKPKAKKKK